MAKGFLESIIEAICLGSIIEASKDKNGKPDPYKAAGIVYGSGMLDNSNTGSFGAMLGAMGAFDDDD